MAVRNGVFERVHAHALLVRVGVGDRRSIGAQHRRRDGHVCAHERAVRLDELQHHVARHLPAAAPTAHSLGRVLGLTAPVPATVDPQHAATM